MVLDERSEDPQSYKNHPDGEHECTTFHANPSDSCRELLLNNLNFTLREKSVWIKVGDWKKTDKTSDHDDGYKIQKWLDPLV